MQLLIHRFSCPGLVPRTATQRTLRSPFSHRRRHIRVAKKTKNPTQRLSKIVITWGAKKRAVPPIFSGKSALHLRSYRELRRSLISALLLFENRNRKNQKMSQKPPFFPSTMGYLRENSLWARTVRPLSKKSRNDPYSSQRGKS